MVRQEIGILIATYLASRNEDEWDVAGLINELKAILPVPPDINEAALSRLSRDEIEEQLIDLAERRYEEKEQQQGAENLRVLERLVMLRTIDTLWVEHLTAMEEMRQGIGLWAYGQRDPLVAYKREAHDMWEQLLDNIRKTVVHTIYHVNLAPAAVPARQPAAVGEGRPAPSMRPNRSESEMALAPAAVASGRKVGRNDPCPCGSGRKYKKCHGRAA
jgi:preprotein translocase subunit SecA